MQCLTKGSCVRAVPSGASPPEKTSHWSSPLLPAFCHITQEFCHIAQE